MKQTVELWLTDYGVRQLIKHPEEVLADACFHIPGTDMSAQGWVKLGPVEVTLPDPQSLVPGAIANLERGMAEIYNEANKKVAMLEKVKAELLALPAPATAPLEPEWPAEKVSPGEHLSSIGAECVYTGIRAFMRSRSAEELLVVRADLWISLAEVYILNVAQRNGEPAWEYSGQTDLPQEGDWCAFVGPLSEHTANIDFPTIYIMHSGSHFQLSEGAANYIDAGAKL